MSQTTKLLKEIASGEEYKALAAAMERADYEATLEPYLRVSSLLEEKRREAEERLASLPMGNREKTRQDFVQAFSLAIPKVLPVFHQISSELARRRIGEGEVLGSGRKGDPLVRTPEGRVIVLTGAPSPLKEGERVRFTVVREAEKMGFGKVFEFTPQTFYSVLTEDIREKIRNSFVSIRGRWKSLNQDSFAGLGELLRELGEVEKLASGLKTGEREEIAARAQEHKKRLLDSAATGLMFASISGEEEKETAAFYPDEEQRSKALAAVGLFRHHRYEAVKRELFWGDNLRNYGEVLAQVEGNIDSMDSAMKSLEFRSAVREAYPRARKYVRKMDQLFQSLEERAREMAEGLAKDGVDEPEKIQSAIRDAFSGEALLSELRKVFSRPEEFFTLREALVELKQKMGDPEIAAAEALFKPYLRHKVSPAFAVSGSKLSSSA